jgi:hypothetical protein
MTKDIAIEIARLDGYLAGVVVLNGQINDYYAGAFLLNVIKNETLESALAAYFSPNCQIHFTNKRAEIDLRKLESEIQGFIADNLFGNKTEFIESTILSDRRKYISFKIMDMIDFLISENEFSPKPCIKEQVHKIEAEFEDTTSDFTFFCISFADKVLVLQFMKPGRSGCA